MRARLYIADARSMEELEDESVDLVVTSPPYWHIKDYGVEGQIGYGQSLHKYLKDLYLVFRECFRVLKGGTKLCINIGDQFARSVVYGKYKVIPLHAEVISMCEQIGFDYMGAIIWQKKTTMNTTGGANIMGSFPYPPNGVVEIDYEFILIFKKEGKRKVERNIKEASKLTKEEWKEYFSGHWNFGGARQIDHEAVFPEELPRRLIKMFSFVGDTVLDPFSGSGTTLKVAVKLNRKAVGYEVNERYASIARQKLGVFGLDIIKREHKEFKTEPVDYRPSVKDAKPLIDERMLKLGKDSLYRVVDVVSEDTILLSTGLKVKLANIRIKDKKSAIEYLNKYVKGKDVILRIYNELADSDTVRAKVFLKNRIHINRKMVQMDIAEEVRDE
ncbi:DNA-methyltransferase [Hydrogenobacter sp. Uz 6-8]|uniref:DNA-methyltransferase n=1 Tax=Hydrogenobacter sp. Uz 6-8 TaxID=3384828 RepID=UPI0038FCF864